MPEADGHAGSSIHTRRARTHGSATAHLQPQRSLRPCRGRARKLRSAAMLDVPASSHFRARQRPAAHKHAHRQHMLQGEGTQAGGRWAVSDTHQISSEDVHLDQAVAISAPSARRARPYISLRAGGRRPRQVGCRSRGWLPQPPGRTPAPDGAARGRACLHDQRPQKSHLEACSPSAAAPVPRLRDSLRSDRFSSVTIFGLICFPNSAQNSKCVHPI